MGLIVKACPACYPVVNAGQGHVMKMQSGISGDTTGCDNLAVRSAEVLIGHSIKTIIELPTHKNNETSLTQLA
jgi:hypothetical protein